MRRMDGREEEEKDNGKIMEEKDNGKEYSHHTVARIEFLGA